MRRRLGDLGRDTLVAELLDDNQRLRAELEELRRLAYRDPLTGLYNRRHFEERLAQEWSRACRFATPLALLAIDCDYLKRINDALGHAAGDEALCWVATVLARCSRSFDVPCRVGGDEFALLLPGSDAEGARAVAERLASEIEIAEAPPVGVSIGWSLAGEASTPADFVALADRAMYRNKRLRKGALSISRGAPEPLASDARAS